MGASSSSSSASPTSPELQEQESLAASTASLPFLRSAFSTLSSSSSSIPPSSLRSLFSLPPNANPNPDLLLHLGPSVASLLFDAADPVSWPHFLTGYNRCCSRMPASSSLNLIFKLYHELCDRARIPCQLEFDSESDKAGGELRSSDLTALFEICWAMERSWRVGSRSEAAGAVPDFKHLVMSVLVDGGEVEDDERIWGCEVLGMDRSVSAQKVQLWVMSRAPELTGCLSRFVREKVKACAAGSSGVSQKTRSLLCACFVFISF